MLGRLACAALGALVLAPAAFADGGPSPPVLQGGPGVMARGGSVRYVALPAATATALEAVRIADGTVLRYTNVSGSWGVPQTIYGAGGAGGLSADRRTLVLAQASNQCCGLRTTSSFLAVYADTFRTRALFTLKGDFAFDAISPDGRWIYLIQHVSARDLTRYVVRRYDVLNLRLDPRRIADRTQRGWVMAGSPVNRATSVGGRYVYTLYQRNNGYAFVHALDTQRGVAHCIGVPWTGSQNAVWNMVLQVRDRGRTLAIHWRSGRPYLLMDTHTWQVSPDEHDFPWLVVLAAAAAALLAAALALRLRRRAVPLRLRPVTGT